MGENGAVSSHPGRAAHETGASFVPREHGATAMLLTPFFAAAILLRQVSWQELAALLAATCALVIKDPLVVIARQRFLWKMEHPETRPAVRAAAWEAALMSVCAISLLLTRDWRPLLALFAGAGAFTALAVLVNLRNRQRSEWFQVASAAALSSSAAAACLAVRGAVPVWCWWLWALSALQATAGIFVVHARLDAKIAGRKGQSAARGSRRAAMILVTALLATAAACGFLGRWWLTTALVLAAAGYRFDLQRQRDPAQLQTPLKRVGMEALTLSTFYALAVVIGLWNW